MNSASDEVQTGTNVQGPEESRSPRKLFVAIPFLFFVLILILHFGLPVRLGQELVFDSFYLLFLLNLVLVFLSSLAVAYLAGRAYTGNGNISLLFLGAGSLAIGLSNGLSSWMLQPGEENVVVTIHNCGVLLASMLHFEGAALASSEILLGRRMTRKRHVLLAYAFVTAVLVFLALFSQEIFPPFFIQSIGPTPLRQMVLGSAMILFLITGFLLLGRHRRSHTDFYYWYSLALLLYAAGLLGVFLQRAVGGPIGWTGRTAQFLAGIFFFIAVLQAYRVARTRKFAVNEVLLEIFKSPRLLYATLVNTTSDAVIVIDGSERILLWNPAAEKMFGYKDEEALGQSLFMLISPGPQSGTLDRSIRVASKSGIEGSAKFELSVKPKGGEIFPVEVSISHASISSQPICTLIFRDITEHKRADQEIREREAKYRRLFENMAEEVHLWQVVRDETGHIETWRLVDANPPALRTWGKTLKEIRGRTTDEIFGPGATDHYMPVVQKIMTENKPFSYEDYFSHLDKHFRFTSVPLGEHFITTGADISTIKQAQEALSRARDDLEIRVKERTAELELKNQELQEFAFVASHDLMEPLRKIQTFGSMLEKGGDRLDERFQDYISRMVGAANRMQELLDALLRYSRVGTQVRDFLPSRLDDILLEVASDLEVSIQKAGAHLEIGHLATVAGDRHQLRQLFQNLIANAIKYRRPEVKTIIRISGEERDGNFLLFVKDNGIGFDEKYLDRIFQPFQRLHGRKEYPGTGMGLAICRKIVDRHGGTITARSVPGKGSTFIVSLPT